MIVLHRRAAKTGHLPTLLQQMIGDGGAYARADASYQRVSLPAHPFTQLSSTRTYLIA